MMSVRTSLSPLPFLLLGLMLAVGPAGCRKEQTLQSEEPISLVLGIDKYYADPEYNQFTGPASGRDRILARVNDEAIRREQLDERLVGILDIRRAAGEPVDPETMDEVRASLLDTLISLTVERQEALRRNFEVPDEELETVIQRFQDEQGGEERLSEALRNAGISEREFRRLCEQEVRVRKLRDQIFNEPVPEPSEEDIWEYYRENQDKWIRVRASSIFIEAPRDVPVERQKKREIAEKIRDQAIQGADFAELAREFSQDENSREAGGDMGWYPLIGLSPKIRSLMKELPVGAVSDIVEISHPGAEGFSIFKMMEFERLTLENPRLRIAIIEEWKNLKREEHYEAWLIRKRDESSIVIHDSKIRETLGV